MKPIGLLVHNMVGSKADLSFQSSVSIWDLGHYYSFVECTYRLFDRVDRLDYVHEQSLLLHAFVLLCGFLGVF